MSGGDARRIAFDAEQELRADEQPAQRHLDARFEAAGRGLVEEGQERPDVASVTGRRYARAPAS